MAGITASVKMVDEIMPPTIGARCGSSLPSVPVPHMIGSRPALIGHTSSSSAGTRSTAPSRLRRTVGRWRDGDFGEALGLSLRPGVIEVRISINHPVSAGKPPAR